MGKVGRGTPTEQSSDEELMIAFQNGDEKGFDALYRRYWVPLRMALSRRVGRRHQNLVGDLFNEAFCRVIRAKQTFDPAKGCFRTWLYTIAFNNHKGLFRSTEIFVRGIAVALVDDIPVPLVDGISVQALLKDLPPREREVMELTVSEEFTPLQAAEILKVPVEVIYKRRHAAMKRLRAQRALREVPSILHLINTE